MYTTLVSVDVLLFSVWGSLGGWCGLSSGSEALGFGDLGFRV